jgi:hypothetical protein
MLGNDLLFKCGIPSYVADSVSVVSWIDSEGQDFFVSRKYGKGTKNEQYQLTIMYKMLG